ncbi:TAF5-like RNA polymerase II p300/CBP-associated factor-associated factor 65 kDa subunit 5L isoform X2 [Ruditapes philippinarum]|uniref:TAF5-like RNA polymerase II p300/CBP-associated factor-associated factor 65 kDa subunit 5L isoform X2 n=1 Tax=Ruditapes philippinarum TaxID=129788 RepID=UPI00295BC524|nr:TAF5-like RNA polymerase II p300/CBP-associated factor-associated factor 65 kDa subunit 5L isoform X2 [Ruditapes philippinarum]
MKRTKSEHLHSTISQYLKRRQYSESETTQKKESRWVQQLPSMALKGSTSGEITQDNTLSFSSISGDAALSEQIFTRLKTFLGEKIALQNVDLQTLLFPVFVHIYIEMLSNGHKAPAHKFFGRHSSLFKTDVDQQSILDQLSKLYSKADMISCKEVQAFKDMKYQVFLPRNKFESLQRFIKNDDNMMLLQILNQHIQLQVAGVYSRASTPYEQVKTDLNPTLGLQDEKLENRQQQPISPAVIPDNKVVQDDLGLSSLKQIIKEVKDGPPGLPSICFYSFLNAYQGLCCASTSDNSTYLSGGFEDSSVRLWRLLPGSFPAVDNSDGPSVIHLAANYLKVLDDEEDKKCEEKECLVLRGHTGSVYQARFSWDSKFLFTCSDDTTVRLWDIEKQTNAAVFRGHNYPVWDVDTSAMGDYFVSCSHDQTAKLWSSERTYPIRSFIGHTYDVDCVRFHPNSNYVATGSGDKTVRMWSIQDGKSVRLLPGHKSSILSLAFSPNGMLLASAGEDRRIRVWDLRNGQLFKEFRGHTDTIYSLSFNQNSSTLASGGLDSCIRVWDLRKSAGSSLSASDNHNSAELLGAFPTKSIPVIYLNYTTHNVLQAAGAV